MIVRGKFVFIISLLAMVFLLGISICPVNHTALAITDGPLLNPGFEEGRKYWTTITPIPDTVKVVGAEGPSQFPTYADMGGITVTPYKGSYMLRLGTPKNISEKQNIGENTASQEFKANNNLIKLSFRLFSWEARNLDVVRIDLKPAGSPNASPVGHITFTDLDPSDGIVTVSSDPRLIRTKNSGKTVLWEVNVDVPKQGDYLDTGWIEAEISGITTGDELVLSYTVGGTNNNAHATWGYFDNINTPPIAKFEFSQEEPLEGDILQLIDLSYDPDPGDTIAAWEWNVHWDYMNWDASSTVKEPFFIPPDNKGTYMVTLTVTDSYGDTDTIKSGEIAHDGYLYVPNDGKSLPTLCVENVAPKVKALNMEVLPGEEVTFIGRFLDPGWLDVHTATLTLDDSPIGNVTLQEDHNAFMGTGIVTAPISATEDQGGTLQVDDSDGAYDPESSTYEDTFQITMADSNPETSHEPNDTLEEAELLQSDGIYLSYIQNEGDLDLYKVDVPPGGELLVTLKDLPADYDLVILKEQPSELEQASFLRGSFLRGSFLRGSFLRGSFLRGSFLRGSFLRGSFLRGSFLRGSFLRGSFLRGSFLRGSFLRGSFDEYPLSDVGFTGLEGNNIGGTDISLAELGLGGIGGENLKVVGFSANRGLTDEVLLASADAGGGPMYIGVFGVNGVWSAEHHYTLQEETYQPPDLTQALKDADITYEVNQVTTEESIEYNYYDNHGTPAWTLFVTQEERLRALCEDSDQWGELVDALQDLAQDDSIRGDIISVPIDDYQPWVNDPFSVDAANEVAAQVRTAIENKLTEDELDGNPDIQYVVLVGSDDIIPYRRVPDETIISNESDYVMSSFIQPGSPLFFSIMEGFNLTDDYYVDRQSTSLHERSLYIPDLAIARLVENPEEIMATANTYLANGGILDPATALVTGYDFFTDGAQAVVDTFPDTLTTDTLINDTWTAEDLRDEFLDQRQDISNINAHCTHYAALSAYGFENEVDDIFTSDEVGSIDNNLLKNIIAFSIGCHAGLNVPDQAAPDAAELELGINPQLDFPQAIAHHGAIYVASTGYSLGDNEGIAGTERLMGVFAEELFKEGATVGSALVNAKQRYLSSLSTITEYDEKSSIQFTLYGLPQYSVIDSLSGSEGIVQALTAQAEGTPVGTLSLTIDGVTVSPQPDLEKVDVNTDTGTYVGSYFTADDDAQATIARPVQPRVVVDLPADGNDPVHGALLQSGQFDIYDGFDPVITRITTTEEIDPEELQILFDSFWPADLASVNTLEIGADGELTQTLVVIPGQFRGTGYENGVVIGTQRLYNTLDFELLRSSSDDWQPPIISSIDLSTDGNSTVAVTVKASDVTTGGSGIDRVVIYHIGNGTVTPTSLVLSEPLPPDGVFTVNVPDVGENDRLTGVVVDGAGNPASFTAKGASMYAIRVDAGPDMGYAPGIPVNLKATIFGFNSLTSPVWYTWDFGDQEFRSGVLKPGDVVIDGEGNATFTVQHTYADDAPRELTATLRVLDANGGIGMDKVTLQQWWDPEGDAVDDNSDLIGGYITNDATEMTVGLRVVGEISDDYQYRIKLKPESGGMFPMKYNAGSWTGLPSLRVEKYGNELRFIFNLADIGIASGDYISWSVETQSGVPSAPEKGIIDEMPDEGSFLWIFR